MPVVRQKVPSCPYLGNRAHRAVYTSSETLQVSWRHFPQPHGTLFRTAPACIAQVRRGGWVQGKDTEHVPQSVLHPQRKKDAWVRDTGAALDKRRYWGYRECR